MYTYNVFICDDDSVFAHWLAQQTEEHLPGPCQISVFSSAKELVDAVTIQSPDICILDIKLGGSSGIDLAKNYFPRESRIQLIYITGYVEYCTDVYETDHIYFLLKPVKCIELKKALSTAVKRLSEHPILLGVQDGDGLYRIPLADILFIESQAHKLHIHTKDHIYEMFGKLSSLPDEILTRMIHCHKSFLVNPDCIKAVITPPGIHTKQFQLFSGEQIPISRSKWKTSQQQFMDLFSMPLK